MAVSFLLYGDRFCQIAGTVHVAAPEHGEMVGEELERDHSEHALERVNCARHLKHVLGPARGLCVPLLNHQDRLPIPGRDLLKGVHALGEHVVSHHDHQDGDSGVHQRQGSMLQLPVRALAREYGVGEILPIPSTGMWLQNQGGTNISLAQYYVRELAKFTNSQDPLVNVAFMLTKIIKYIR